MYFLANNDNHGTYVDCNDIFCVHICFAVNAIPYSENFGRGKLWRIGEFSVIRQSFTPPKIPLENFTKVRLQCINTK